MNKERIVVAISGASGAIFGVRLVKALVDMSFDVRLILSEFAKVTLKHECDINASDLEKIATKSYDINDLSSDIASGSFKTKAMIVAPCSIKSLSAISSSFNNNLLTRAADVHLKEARPLLLMVRESPLHIGHMDLMKKAALMGATIIPPNISFWDKPTTIDDIINQQVGRILNFLNIESNLARTWHGLEETEALREKSLIKNKEDIIF